MKINTTVEFSEKEKESLIIVHDIIETIKNYMNDSMNIVEDSCDNNFSYEDICNFEELLFSSLKDNNIKIREEEK